MDVIAIFDVGKTNKKLLLFDADYRVVFEEQTQFEEILDDDGFHGDDLNRLTTWLKMGLETVLSDERFDVRAVNCTAYGASLVNLDGAGQPVTPLYNYLKPFPENLRQQFFADYGPVGEFGAQTASPDLGMLNSGLQLYWLKYEKPWLYRQIEHALHLPQYCAYVFTGQPFSEVTSLGCHTALWDFGQKKYHRWVAEERMNAFGQMMMPSFLTSPPRPRGGHFGIGIHDSSAALVPYLLAFSEPFLLLSTGTWCITLNPFSTQLLTGDDLRRDCLNYLNFRGDPVRASRLFAGNEHERRVRHLSEYFSVPVDFYKQIPFDSGCVLALRTRFRQAQPEAVSLGSLQDSAFAERILNEFANYKEAYHQLMLDLMAQQITSIRLAKGEISVTKLFVDGGFSRSPIYMNLLAEAFPELEVYASELAQATALGAALVIAPSWNPKSFGREQFGLKRY
ncbi:MAG: carbohydrate kinase [Cytophagaceae bacterium]|nr:carbohydrate kinase [Cytophagaceae bacterium]